MGKRFDSLIFPNGSNKALTFSYDDGVVQDKRLIAIFDKHHVKCTFNLGYGVLGYKNDGGPFDISKVEKEEVKELYKDHEVGGHSLYHSDLTALKSPYAMYEILEDKVKLEELCGYPLKMFAYPFGLYNREVEELLKIAGYEGARTVVSTHDFDLPEDRLALHPTCHHNDEELFELAKRFVEEKTFKPRLFYLWGHAYEFDRDDNWERIDEFLTYLDPYLDQIWCATNGQILNYLKAYDMLEYSVDGSMIYNPSATDVRILTAFGMRETLKAGTLTKVKDTPL